MKLVDTCCGIVGKCHILSYVYMNKIHLVLSSDSGNEIENVFNSWLRNAGIYVHRNMCVAILTINQHRPCNLVSEDGMFLVIYLIIIIILLQAMRHKGRYFLLQGGPGIRTGVIRHLLHQR